MPRTKAAKRCRCGKRVWERKRRYGTIEFAAGWETADGICGILISTFCPYCGDALLAHGHTEPHPARLREEKEAETDGHADG